MNVGKDQNGQDGEHHICLINMARWAVVALALNPSTRKQRQVNLCKFEASLAYPASSRIVKATEKPVVNRKQQKIK